MNTPKKTINRHACTVVTLIKTIHNNTFSREKLRIPIPHFDAIHVRVGFIASLVTIALALPALGALMSGWLDHYSEEYFMGAWVTDYQDTISDTMDCRQIGKQSCTASISTLNLGSVECRRKTGVLDVVNTHEFRVGGKWTIEGDRIVFVIHDVNSRELESTIAGVPFPTQINASDSVTRGMPFSFKIIDRQDDFFLASKINENGEEHYVYFYKKESPALVKAH